MEDQKSSTHLGLSYGPSSAVPASIKYSTFRQEVGRILKNTSLHLPWHHKADLLSNFSWRLKVSGYSRGFRSKALSDGIAGNINNLDRRLRTNFPFNRPKDVIQLHGRNKRNVLSNWFNRNKSNSNSVTYDTVLFVPSTPSSNLANILKQRIIKEGNHE